MTAKLSIATGLAMAVVSSAACGGASTSPSQPFTLASGSYTLRIAGGSASVGTTPNVCATIGPSMIEGSVPVIVTRSGSAWSTIPSATPDPAWTMSFSTDGAAAGYVTGSVAGPAVDPATNVKINVTSAVLTGSTTSTNGAGGTVQGSVTFSTLSSSAFCTQATWTLTPR